MLAMLVFEQPLTGECPLTNYPPAPKSADRPPSIGQ